MNKQKPVWRMNTGNGAPSDLGDRVMFTDGVLAKPWDSDFTDPKQWELIRDPSDYGAYQTTRTKAAKYERMECYVCEGDGFVFIPVAWSGDALKEKCACCNGKGYRLEAVK